LNLRPIILQDKEELIMTFFEELKKTITDVSGTVVKKSGEVVETQKLKMKKYSIESDIRKDYELMGRIFFAEMEETGNIDENVEEIFQRIVEAKDAVAEIDEKLSKYSKGKVCAVCGEKASKNMTYCPYCGSKFEDEPEADFEKAEFEEDVVEKTEDAAEVTEENADAEEAVTENVSEEAEAEATTEEASEAPDEETSENAEEKTE
jgi:hypothetical protein